jgi:hypothetical protein
VVLPGQLASILIEGVSSLLGQLSIACRISRCKGVELATDVDQIKHALSCKDRNIFLQAVLLE